MADEPDQTTPTEGEQTTPETTDDTATTTQDQEQETPAEEPAKTESKSQQRRKAASKPAAQPVLGDDTSFDAVQHGKDTAERNVAAEAKANS